MSKIIKHTPRVWCDIKRIRILDPDGWRKDHKSFNAPLTEEEFDRRMFFSTIEPVVSSSVHLVLFGHGRSVHDEAWDDEGSFTDDAC